MTYLIVNNVSPAGLQKEHRPYLNLTIPDMHNVLSAIKAYCMSISDEMNKQNHLRY